MAVDRISELPESILHRILSSLSHKQAIQTSALSKTWRHVGPTGPKIELRERFFKNSGRANFLSALGKTLQRYIHRNLSVHEFIFEMSSESESKSNDRHNLVIDSEPISVLDKGIQMLLMNMGVKRFDFSIPNYIVDLSLVFRAEFLTELCLSECKFMTTTSNDHELPLFKGLKRLSLNKVHIEDGAFETIVRICPLIEYLLVSGCVGLKTIPANIFEAEFLTELHLAGCHFTLIYELRGPNLIVHMSTCSSTDQLPLIKRLKTLSLDKVNIPAETLEKIMRSFPLIERLLLTDCPELTKIQLNNNDNLKHFSGSFSRVNSPSIEIDVLTIETIRIVRCHTWYGHDIYFFPRLKSLYLSIVRLSAEFFQSLSSNFPSLEELKIHRCFGFREIQMTVCSIKRLVLTLDFVMRINITIYAPNIRYFELSTHHPSQLTFHTETARKWKSHVVMVSRNCSDDKVSTLPWLLQLSELLNSLSESQISVDVFPNPFKNLKVKDTNDASFSKPIPLEQVHVKGGVSRGNLFSSFPDFLNCLFLICRPKYICVSWYITNSEIYLKKEKNKLAEYIIFNIIPNHGVMSLGYLWEGDLEEISMQVWDENSQGWHTVRVEGTSFPGFTSSDTKIRFPLKWRG